MPYSGPRGAAPSSGGAGRRGRWPGVLLDKRCLSKQYYDSPLFPHFLSCPWRPLTSLAAKGEPASPPLHVCIAGNREKLEKNFWALIFMAAHAHPRHPAIDARSMTQHETTPPCHPALDAGSRKRQTSGTSRRRGKEGALRRQPCVFPAKAGIQDNADKRHLSASGRSRGAAEP